MVQIIGEKQVTVANVHVQVSIDNELVVRFGDKLLSVLQARLQKAAQVFLRDVRDYHDSERRSASNGGNDPGGLEDGLAKREAERVQDALAQQKRPERPVAGDVGAGGAGDVEHGSGEPKTEA